MSTKAQVVGLLQTALTSAQGLPADPVVVPPPPPPPPPSGVATWARVDVGNGGMFGAYFRRPVVIPGGLWAAWGSNAQSAQHGSFTWSAATGLWTKTSASSGIGYDIGARENYGACYDTDRACVWIGAGAPVAYSQTGDMKFALASAAYTQPYLPGQGQGDACYAYWQGALYSFGGWSGSQALRKRDLMSGVIANISGASPPWTRQSLYGGAEEESPRLTYARSGIDARDGTLWTLANDNQLWTHPPGDGAWTMQTTTGDKPDTLGIVAALVEGQNVVVAWCGRTGMVAAGSGVVRQATWFLNLATKVWSKGPSLAAGNVVPRAVVMSASNLLSDGTSALLTVDGGGPGTEVWRLSWGSP